MGKKHDLDEASTLISTALRHKIGSLVNFQEPYADRYAKDSVVLTKEARKVLLRHNWNADDKRELQELVKKKLHKELKEKNVHRRRKISLYR